MEVKTAKDAQRIAYFGMLKMKREGGYALNQSRTVSRFWHVTKEDGTFYIVSLGFVESGIVIPPSCDCPFYEKNEQFHTCKHIQWVQDRLEEEAAWVARMEEQDAIADDATAFMEACRMERGA